MVKKIIIVFAFISALLFASPVKATFECSDPNHLVDIKITGITPNPYYENSNRNIIVTLDGSDLTKNDQYFLTIDCGGIALMDPDSTTGTVIENGGPLIVVFNYNQTLRDCVDTSINLSRNIHLRKPGGAIPKDICYFASPTVNFSSQPISCSYSLNPNESKPSETITVNVPSFIPPAGHILNLVLVDNADNIMSTIAHYDQTIIEYTFSAPNNVGKYWVKMEDPSNSNTYCSPQILNVSLNPDKEISATPPPEISNSCGGATNPYLDECLKCITPSEKYPNGGSWTALGCIDTSPDGFVSWFLTGAIGIGGGIAFLIMLWGVFTTITSTGNPDKLNQGREIIVSAIAGLIMIIFSVFLLKIIGVDILRIPGFGG